MTPRSTSARGKGVGIAVSVTAVVVAAAAVGIWQRPSPPEGAAPHAAPGVPIMTFVPDPAEPPAPSPVPDLLTQSFDELADELPGRIGLAFASISDPEQVTALGDWSHGPAWSTIKVPLAMALLRETGGIVGSDMASAITASDNSAAQSMWEQLGGGASAAGKVRDVLASGGNPTTIVPSEPQRPGFSIFGQTDWALTDQARFLADTACRPEAAPVTDLMREIVPGQQWGLGAVDGGYFKGGWGPGTDGLYLVRQFGVVPTKAGEVAVSIAAVSDSGGFGDGTAMLDRLTGWVQQHLDQLGGGQCPPAVGVPS